MGQSPPRRRDLVLVGKQRADREPPGPVHSADFPSAGFLSPINLILISAFLVAFYFRLRPKAAQTLPPLPPPAVFKTYTPPELRPYNGTDGMPVYLAVRGKVFDVTSGRNFYGPGGPYENFAGRDATRGLACGSFDEEMLTKDLEGALDDLNGLGADEMDSLRGWEERFNEKYLVVGELLSVKDAEKRRNKETDAVTVKSLPQREF